MPQFDSTPPVNGAFTPRQPRQSGRQGGRLALVGVALVAASTGYWIGQSREYQTEVWAPPTSITTSAITSAPLTAAGDPQDLIDRMATSVGQMQADLTRLNSLGQRLLERAGLDADDFDLAAAAGAGGGPERVSLRPNRADEVAQDLAKVLGECDDRKCKLALLETLMPRVIACVRARSFARSARPDALPAPTSTSRSAATARRSIRCATSTCATGRDSHVSER